MKDPRKFSAIRHDITLYLFAAEMGVVADERMVPHWLEVSYTRLSILVST